MMTRNHGKIGFECDACGDVLETETKDFGEARGELAREGWSARKFGTDWNHYCGTCGVPEGK